MNHTFAQTLILTKSNLYPEFNPYSNLTPTLLRIQSQPRPITNPYFTPEFERYPYPLPNPKPAPYLISVRR